MHRLSALVFATLLAVVSACDAPGNQDRAALTANEAPHHGQDGGSGHGRQDAGMPDAGMPDAGVAPHGVFYQFSGQADAVTRGCGVAGLDDEHFTHCSLYAMSGTSQIDVGHWGYEADGGIDVWDFWAWDVWPTDPARTQVGPIWAGVAELPDGAQIVASTYGGGLQSYVIAHPEDVVGSFVGWIAPDNSSTTSVPFGGIQGEVSFSSVVASGGKVVVGGHFTGTQVFGSSLAVSASEPRPFVMQLSPDSTLEPLWLTELAPAGETGNVEAVVATQEGGVLVGGSRGAVGEAARPFLARLDASGVLLWERSFDALEGKVTHVAVDGDRWYAALDAVGGLSWNQEERSLSSGTGVLLAGVGETEAWALPSDVPLTALAAGFGRLVAIGAAQRPVTFGDTLVPMSTVAPSVFLLGLEPSSGATTWQRVYTSLGTPFSFDQALVLPSTRLLVSGTERYPTDFDVGWRPDDLGTPVGLWLLFSPLP